MRAGLLAGRRRREQTPTAGDAAERRASYEALAHAHEGVLLRAARRLVRGDEDRAQDLVQEALVRAYQAYVDGRFDDGTNAQAWLLRIMTNGFINEYRRERKWSSDVDLEDVLESGTAGCTMHEMPESERPEAALMAATLDEPLERALGALSAEARACVLLVDVEGLEYNEAAQALSVPVGTVRSRLSRARLQLHAMLHGYARETGRL